jgi:hypothetical protein
VGFRKREGTTEGHAWVEYKGLPLNEEPTTVLTYWVVENAADFDRQKTRD